jgi:hypothetical protein
VERRFQGNGAWNLVRWAKEAKDLSSVLPHSFVTFAQLVTSCDQLPRSPVTTRSWAHWYLQVSRLVRYLLEAVCVAYVSHMCRRLFTAGSSILQFNMRRARRDGRHLVVPMT